MQHIDRQALASVTGGFGALLGALLQATPGILQGVSGIISASKSGGSTGPAAAAGPTGAPQGQGQPDPASMQPAASAAPTGSQGSSCSCGSPSFPQVVQLIRFG